MTTTDTLIRAYMNAAAELVQQAINDAQRERPEDLAELRRALQAGALLGLQSTFAPTAGLARLSINLTEPNGTAHQLLSCELQRETQQ